MPLNIEDEETAESFAVSLADLTVNSKPLINFLTGVAEENLGQAQAIVEAVGEHLLKVPTVVKLPILYLIDSIMKNVGRDYIPLFSPVLVQSLSNIYQAADKMTRQLICRLRQTWADIIPSEVLSVVDMQIHSLDPTWPLVGGFSEDYKTKPLKVLLNPNFLPQASETVTSEVDEADVLREQLLQQKRVRELERKQKQVDQQHSELQSKVRVEIAKASGEVPSQESLQNNVTASVAFNEESSDSQADLLREQLLLQRRIREQEKNQKQDDQQCFHKAGSVYVENSETSVKAYSQESQEINMIASAALIEESNESQADSTTQVDPSLNLTVEVNLLASTNETKNASPQDKSDNNKLINLLSDLISRQKHKPQKERKQDHHKKDERSRRYYYVDCQPMYSKEKQRRSYRHDPNEYYGRHCRYSSHRSRKDRAECRKTIMETSRQSYTQRSRERPHHSPQQCSSRKTRGLSSEKLERLSHSSSDSNSTTKVTQASQVPPPDRGDSGKDELGEKMNNCHHLPSASLKRKIETSEVCYELDEKIPCVDIASNGVIDSLRSSTKFLHRKTGHTKAANPTSSFSDTCQLAPISSHIHSAHKFSFRSRCDSHEKSIQIRLEREIDYKHGYGVPEYHTFTGFDHNRNEQSYRNDRNVEGRWKPSSITENIKATGYFVSLPPADACVLRHIAQDPMRTISVDKVSHEVRFYKDIAVIGLREDSPRQVSFKPGEASIILNNFVINCAFHSPEKEIAVMGKLFRLRLGAPTRELYINNEGFQCSFNCEPKFIQLCSGEVVSVRLQSSTVPLVQIGPSCRDLVAGHVKLIIDAVDFINIFLDAKPQRFDIGGEPHILQFADAFQTILVNDQIVDLQFGGPPIFVTTQSSKHSLQLSALPLGLIPGKFNVLGMIHTQRGANRTHSLPVYPLHHSDEHTTLKSRKRSNVELCNRNIKQHVPYHILTSIAPCYEPQLNMSINSWSSYSPVTNTSFNFDRSKVSIGTSNPSSSVKLPNRILTLTSSQSSHLKADDFSAFQPGVNIHKLFQSLCDVGLLTHKNIQSEFKGDDCLVKEIFDVNFNEPPTLKRKQLGLVEILYSGVQCSSCGERFPPQHNDVFREHLDWHFQKNHTLRKPKSRMWFCNKKNWVAKVSNQVNEEFGENKPNHKDSEAEEFSVPSHTYPQGTVCEVCREKFEEYFNEEQDEWHLKDCICNEGSIYHPACFKDFKVISGVSIDRRLQLLEDQDSSDKSTEVCEKSNSHLVDVPGPIAFENGTELFPTDARKDKEEVLSPCKSLNHIEQQPFQQELTQELVLIDTSNADIRHEEENFLDSSTKISEEKCRCVTSCDTGERESVDPTEKEENTVELPYLVMDESVAPVQITVMSPYTPPNSLEAMVAISSDISLVEESSLSSQQLESEILKEKLIGRKLTVLPPLIKGCEISNMCSVS